MHIILLHDMYNICEEETFNFVVQEIKSQPNFLTIQYLPACKTPLFLCHYSAGMVHQVANPCPA